MSDAACSRPGGRTNRSATWTTLVAAVLFVVALFAGPSVTARAGDARTALLDVNVTGYTVGAKTYDGGTGTGDLSVTGITTDIPVTVGYTAVFADKNVGPAVAVDITFFVTGLDALLYQITPGTETVHTTAAIDPRTLTPAITAADKVYDGTNAASVAWAPFGGLVPGDDVVLDSGTRTFADANIGMNKLVTVAGIVIHSGADAGNYVLGSTTATDLADITARPLHVTASASNKVYDADRAAMVSLSSDALPGDVVPLAYTTALFDTKDVGTGKTVTVSGISIVGLSNYALANTSATALADISQRPLTVFAFASDKVYDGLLGATMMFTSDKLPGDFVTVTGTASFATKTVAFDKVVTADNLSLTGADAGNYSISNPHPTSLADITRRTLNVSATAADKPYDGNTNAVATLSSDKVAGDLITLTYVSASFDTKFVGTGKLVTVNGIAMGGFDVPNYTLGNTTATTTAAITPVLKLDAGDRVYDAIAGAGDSLYAGLTSYLFPVDINGDGRQDIVNATTRGVQVFRNDGFVAGHLKLVLVQEIAATYSHGGGAVDIDADGDMDLVLGDWEFVKICTNDGTGLFTVSNAIPHGFAQPTVAIPFHSKVNTASPQDEVRIALSPSSDSIVGRNLIGGNPNDHVPHLYVLHRDVLGSWVVVQQLDSFNVDSVSAHDLNADGDVDLLASNRSGNVTSTPVYMYQSIPGGYSRITGFDLSTYGLGFSYGPTDPIEGTQFLQNVAYQGFGIGGWHRFSVFPGSIGSFASPTHISLDPNYAAGYPIGEAWASAFADMDGDHVADFVGIGRATPLELMRLNANPNLAANRFTAELLSGVSMDLSVRDFDTDSNNAPDVIVGRSDGLWYYHNVNGGDPGSGVVIPPPPPPTPGEELKAAGDALYAALDPNAPNPLGGSNPTFNNGGGLSYYDTARQHAALALSFLTGIDPAYTNTVPNVIYGATNSDKVETLRNYWNKIAQAHAELGLAAGLTTDPVDLATIADIQAHLLSAQVGIVAQGQSLGGIGAPFKKGGVTKALKKLRIASLKDQARMLDAIAAARNATDPATRLRFIDIATNAGGRSLKSVQRYVRALERGAKNGR